MDIKMFFEFPGVLITIGVFLLVVSIKEKELQEYIAYAIGGK